MMKEVKNYKPFIMPKSGKIPSVSCAIEVCEPTKYTFYIKKNELILFETKVTIDLITGYNEITVPANVEINVGDTLSIVYEPLQVRQ